MMDRRFLLSLLFVGIPSIALARGKGGYGDDNGGDDNGHDGDNGGDDGGNGDGAGVGSGEPGGDFGRCRKHLRWCDEH